MNKKLNKIAITTIQKILKNDIICRKQTKGKKNNNSFSNLVSKTGKEC